MKYLIIILTLIYSSSCKQKKDNALVGKTFYRITKDKDKHILYEFCDASINEIKIYRDSVFENFGQEYYYMKISEISRINESYIIKTKGVVDIYNMKMIDSVSGFWKINNHIYVDSIKSNRIEKIIEPCIECHDKETCDEWAKEEEQIKQQKVIQKKIKPLISNQSISKKWQGNYHYLDEEGHTAGGDWTGHYTEYRITQDTVHLTTSGRMSGREDYYLAEEKGDTLLLYRYQMLWGDKDLYKTVEEEKLYKKGDTYYFLVKGEEKKGVKKSDNEIEEVQESDEPSFTIKVDNLRVRKTPELDGAEIELLPINTQVVYLEEKSNLEEEIRLNGDKIIDYWYKVKTPQGNIGWVHGCCITKN